MLVCNGNKLFFYANASREDRASRMELDFLIQKNKITNRHNITPIEVKSGKRYTLNSINKARTKYGEYLTKPIVIHTSDFNEMDDVLYLPIYMTPML